jgi:peptidoglycan hydrolase-like protein with peptidoglycan-binding domain
MRGEVVAQLQRRLRGLCYHLVVDGDFGPATRRMVMAFQSDQGLAADGVAGPRTLARIEAMAGAAIPG